MDKKWVILASILALPIAYAQRFGSSLYGFGGGFGGGYGLLDLNYLYGQFPGWIDFLVFFAIFAGAARLVFTKMFGNEPGAKALYVGLGLALSVGGVYYGYLSLEALGRFALPFGILIGGVCIFGLLRMVGANKWVAAILTIAVLLIGAPLLINISGAGYAENLAFSIPSSIYNTIIAVGLIVGLFWFIFSQARKYLKNMGRGSTTEGSQGLRRMDRDLPEDEEEYRGEAVKSTRKIRRKGKSLGKMLSKGHTAFMQLQYARVTELVSLINEWVDMERAYQAGKGDANTLDKIDSRKKDILGLLHTINGGSRYQLRMLRKGRKMADQLRNAGGKDIAGIYDNLESSEHYFRQYINDMIKAVEAGKYSDVAKIYGSIRNVFVEMRDNYNEVERMYDDFMRRVRYAEKSKENLAKSYPKGVRM